MNPARDITQDLQDWLHEPDRLPPPRISEVAPLVHRTPQHRGLVPPLPRRFPSMLTATTSLTAAVIVALVGGFLLTGLPTQPADDRSLGRAPVESTMADSTPMISVLDSPRDHGTIISQAGTLAWEQFHDTSAPRFEESWEWLGESIIARNFDDGRLFVSPDGIDWNTLALPDLPAGVRPRDLRPAHGGGVAWLLAPADTGPEGRRCRRRPASQSTECQDRPVLAWRSIDGRVWKSVESGNWPRPAPAGFEWKPRLHDVVSNGEVALGLEDTEGTFPGAQWASALCSPRLWRDGDNDYLLVSEETEDDCPTPSDPIRLLVAEENDGLVMTDRDSGEAVRIVGADRAVLDWIVDQDRYGIGASERLVVVSDAGISYVSTPWQVDEYADASLFASDGIFYAYIPAPSTATTTSATPSRPAADLQTPSVSGATVWRSEDGIDWSELGRADAPDLVGTTDSQIDAHARAVYLEGDGRVLAASLDGLDFNKLPAGSPELWKTTLTPLGWVAVERFHANFPGPRLTGDAAWLHQGDEWVSLGPLGFDCGVDDDGEPSSVGWVGETIFISARVCDSTTGDTSSDIWLIRKGSP